MKIREEKQIVCLEKENGEIVWELIPEALESCMKPGEFRITPIQVREDEESLHFSIGTRVEVVKKKQIEEGEMRLITKAFHPQIVRRKGGCKPCTNCGGCSW